jgi:hypothetical protein
MLLMFAGVVLLLAVWSRTFRWFSCRYAADWLQALGLAERDSFRYKLRLGPMILFRRRKT